MAQQIDVLRHNCKNLIWLVLLDVWFIPNHHIIIIHHIIIYYHLYEKGNYTQLN